MQEAEAALSKEFESNKLKNSDICELNKKINDLKREKGQWHAKLSEARAKLNANNDEVNYTLQKFLYITARLRFQSSNFIEWKSFAI